MLSFAPQRGPLSLGALPTSVETAFAPDIGMVVDIWMKAPIRPFDAGAEQHMLVAG